MPCFIIVASLCKAKQGMGMDNLIPWDIPEDKRVFDQLALDDTNVYILGRVTWENLPYKYESIRKKHVIVVSREMVFGAISVPTLEKAIEKAAEMSNGTMVVLGGETLYKEAIKHDLCVGIYVTQIHEAYECDTFFPSFPAHFYLSACSPWKCCDDTSAYCFMKWQRKELNATR